MLKSITYVSAHQLEGQSLKDELADIVDISTHNNGLSDVSGALIATDCYFGQVLQGPSARVDALLVAINNDQRHENLTILEERTINQKNCPVWKLSYFGEAGYINRQIFPLISNQPSDGFNYDKQRVIDMISEFCRR